MAATVGLAYSHLVQREPDRAVISQLLPPRPLLVLCRERELGSIIERYQSGARTRNCSLQAITAIRGWPGVGKTTLAAELLYRREIRDIFPDGFLWTSLGKSPDVPRLLRLWACALGDRESAAVEAVDELSLRLAGILASRRMLLVVDDVWNAPTARPFLVGGPECGILVTTRLPAVAEELTPSPAQRYQLNVLEEDEAMQLLGELAPSSVAHAPAACRALVREIEGLPLAIVVGGRLLEAELRRGLRGELVRRAVENLLTDIRKGAEAILASRAPADMADLVSQTTPSVAALLRKSTDLLDHQTRERFAYLAGFAPKPAVLRLQDIAGVWQVAEEDAMSTIAELSDCGLIEAVAEQRYWMHALIVSLANSLCTE